MAMSSSDEDSGEENIRSHLSNLLTTADRLLDVAEHGQVDQASSSKLENKFRSLEERLLELHIEESSKAVSSSHHHLNPCSNLVSLLCRKDRCNRLLVTLLPNNEGYSVHILISSGPGGGGGGNSSSSNPGNQQEVELFRLPYEDDDFLTYIDNEELPTSILDLLEKGWSELFYSGCVIAEIRDNRRIHHGTNEDLAGLTSHVLLRPTTQSIICDGKLICERSGWTTREERAMVESQLCLATQGPLCLDPNPVVSLMAKKSCVRRQKFATPAMRRHAKMFSQAGLNRKRKLEEMTGPPELQLHDFVQKRPNHKNNAQEMLQQHQAMMRANLRSIIQGSQPANGGGLATTASTVAAVSAMTTPATNDNLVSEVSKHARAIQKRADVNDMTPHVVEEYILETAERGANRIYHTKLTIYQRLANEEYLGELYVERDFNERDKKGSTCRFVLGTRPHALRYINQFTEIFTEEGRKPVKITHLVPNQKPRITFTPGMRERMNERAAAVAAANAARATLTIGSNASSSSSSASTATAVPSNASSTNSTNLNNSAAATVPVNNGIKKQVSLSVSVAAAAAAPGQQPQIQPSILQQTLSAPSGSQIPPPPIPAAVVRSATVMHQQPPPPSVQLPQTPHPPAPHPPPPQQLPDNLPPTASAENSNSGEQEMAISAIMQSLMKDSAQFEVESKQQQQSQIGLNQLPTCPVPQASLGNLCNSSSTSPVKLPTTPQSPSQSSSASLLTSSSSSTLLAKRVSLKNLLSAQAAQNSDGACHGNSNSPIKSPVKVTMSQLAAQLSRPVTITSNLPSYTQAIADQKGTQASPRPRFIVTTQSGSVTAASGIGKMESPNLQALLGSANANPATVDNNAAVIPVELGNANNPSLLERLVSGQPISSVSSPPVVNSNRSSSTDNEITLAALLSKPPVQNMQSPSSSVSTSQMGSPTKASPLIQQLQQPIPQPANSRGTPIQLPQSPRQQSSPRLNNASALSSPRGHNNSLHPPSHLQPPQQLMQQQPHPAKMQQAELPNGHNGNNMVSLQNILQSGMAVQVSQHPATQTTSSSIPVQFNIPGLSAPVTLSVNVQEQQQPQLQSGAPQSLQSQPTQKLVPTSTVMANTTSSGTVLIPQGSNIIQLPQQPINMRTQTVQIANANNLLKAGTAQVVQVRGSQPPLYVQMPVTSSATGVVSSVPGGGGGGGQSILVRSVVDQRQQPFNVASAAAGGGPPQQQLILNSVKSQPSLIALSQQQQLPQQPVVLQANNTTAVLSTQPQSRQVAIQLQEQPMAQAATAKLQVASGNQRMRQQRKQSLK